MAIKFLNPIEASGTRPVTITGGATGSVAIKGNAAGWATGYLFTGSSGTNRGGFGALGSSDALTYFWIGDAYNDATMVIEPNAGNVGIGTTSPSQKLVVRDGADTKMLGFGSPTGASSDPCIMASDSSGNLDRIFQRQISTNSVFVGDIDDNNGDVFVRAGGATEFTIKNGGNVGIGTTSPSDKLTVTGDIVTTAGQDGGMRIGGWPYNPTGYSFIGTTNMTGLEYCMLSDGTNTFVGAGSGGALRLRGPANDSSPQIEIDGSLCKVDTGDFKVEDGSIAVGNITNSTTNGRIDASNDVVAFSTSDVRLKDNIKSIDKALDKGNSIQGIEFDWIEKEEVHGNSGHDIGVIAQEIEEILPDVVTTRDSGYKAVKYEKIVPLLIEAIKDLSKQVDGLKRLI